MQVYLIRHTTPDVPKGFIYGQLDVSLSDTFQEEAQKVLAKVPGDFDRCYTSPLQRCKLLSQQIQTDHLLEDDRLKEVNFGKWEGKYWNNIPEEELNPWMEDYLNQAPPEGESLIMMQKRVLAFWEEIKQYHPNQQIAIITHAGVIRIMRAYLENIPLKEIFNTSVDYGEVFQYYV